MVGLVIFDLDGTLVNAYPAVSQSINFTLKRLGLPLRSNEEIKRSVGWGDRHLLTGFVGQSLAAQALRIYRRHHTQALRKTGGVTFLPGAKALIEYLKKKGFRLAIASNRPTKFTLIILNGLKARGCFDKVLCADRVPRPKPAPDLVNTILRQLKVPRDQALYVGDMTIDVHTGRRARVRTIAVATGSSTVKELKALKPLRVINKITQLKSIIDVLAY